MILPIGIAVLGTFRRPGIQYHVPRSGTFSKLYVDMCGKLDPGACSTKIKTQAPKALHFLGMKLNLSAANSLPSGIGTALPYLILLALVILTGWYQVRQTQARQLKSGGAAPNAQMQAVTKIMPIFFGVISYSFSAATTIYFVVSNLWRIGQQHFVLNKMYEEEHARPVGAGSSQAPAIAGPDDAPADPEGSAGGAQKPSPNAARRKKKKRKR